MKRYIVVLAAGFFATTSFSQDVLVRVYGKILNKKDSSAISTTLLYEKLPYYDDMGMAASAADGSYEFQLIKDTKYNIRVDNLDGYESFLEEINVEDDDGDLSATKDFFISPVEEEELIRLDNLTFARGSATIQSSSFTALNDFIEYINERPDVNIQLEGHTDFAGNADANMRLSEARVLAVAEYLTKNGVKKNRVTTKAFGGTQPLSIERTDEAKALNRRVEVRLIRQ